MKEFILNITILIVLLLLSIFVVYLTIVISVFYESLGWYSLKISIFLIGMIALGFLTKAAWRYLDEIYYSYKAYRRNRPVKILYRVKSKLDR